MNTPIYDFVSRYAAKQQLRLHMPGHKGVSFIGAEAFDITEVKGADSLYEALGIIKESEENAGRLFGAQSFYSTEGSSHVIRAMLYLAVLFAREKGKKPHVLAGRNVHKVFLSAAALLDLTVSWLYPKGGDAYLSCTVDTAELQRIFDNENTRPTALYLTSPDYLGRTVDVAAVSALCRRYDVLLLVDNAHGAYLRFLSPSRHPMDLGADMCADSAHKTLPVLTGGAYLHIRKNAPVFLPREAKRALMLFGSTSPSYLTLASLDKANAYMENGYRERLDNFVKIVKKCKSELTKLGFSLYGDEPLKITIAPKSFGYCGVDVAAYLHKNGIVCEFADADFTVLMLTPENTSDDLQRLVSVLSALPRSSPIGDVPPLTVKSSAITSVREACFAPSEAVAVEKSLGRILADASVGCPPAVPILVAGERITRAAIDAFLYYGVHTVSVVKESEGEA